MGGRGSHFCICITMRFMQPVSKTHEIAALGMVPPLVMIIALHAHVYVLLVPTPKYCS
jgi:hypothetical protein